MKITSKILLFSVLVFEGALIVEQHGDEAVVVVHCSSWCWAALFLAVAVCCWFSPLDLLCLPLSRVCNTLVRGGVPSKSLTFFDLRPNA